MAEHQDVTRRLAECDQHNDTLQRALADMQRTLQEQSAQSKRLQTDAEHFKEAAEQSKAHLQRVESEGSAF